MYSEEFEDKLSEALELQVFSYNSAVTNEVWVVLMAIASSPEVVCSDQIAAATHMSPTHVELIQYLICNNDYAEYGTSPRCCWLTEKGKKLYQELLELRG